MCRVFCCLPLTHVGVLDSGGALRVAGSVLFIAVCTAEMFMVVYVAVDVTVGGVVRAAAFHTFGC